MHPKKITIAEVATRAGVSVSTVSRVLNGVDNVAPDLATRVRDAVDALGYQPNAAAQGLARGRSGTIGVLVPDLANPHFHETVKAVSAGAGESGRRVLVMDSDEDHARERLLAEDLLRHSDGILLCAPRMSRADLAAIAARGKPLVVVNRLDHGLAISSITVDFFHGMLALCGHLAQLGHREVAYLAGPERAWAGGERLRALLAAQSFGLRVHHIPCGSTTSQGYDAVDAALDLPVTAVVAYNDFVALGAYARLTELGTGVPDPLSLAGFDDIPFSRFAAPPLTTVRVPRAEVGRAAWETLAALLAGETDIEPRVISPELVVRDSTRAI